MKENLLIGRLLRLVVAIGCTALSYFGLYAAFLAWTYLQSSHISPSQSPLLYLFSLLWVAAWAAYFLILFFWIINGHAPRFLVIIGTVLGALSLIPVPFGLIFTLPACALMVYVLIQSFSTDKTS